MPWCVNIQTEKSSMEFIRDRENWSLILAGLFFLGVAVFAFYLYGVSQTDLFHHDSVHIPAALFAGLAFIFLSGSMAIWLAFYNRKTQAWTKEDKPPTPDMVERKRISLEIHLRNKKTTESIQYAKRIQSAILPNMKLIHRALPDSFILYKPRDVVSGDFPWFVQVKDEIFMAAVDCTGHGVPGALLSLVGYFLLNDIVRSRRVTDPGKILDLLDEGVSTTLRPAEDAGTKDGMDISLCKINMQNREVEYAGAHRPLYMMRDGILEEIKGNKFPIGGGIFKNQTNFTRYRIKLNSGDSIYYCSDGYCDQFGGPDGKKFGTRQLRQVIGKVHTLPMKDAHQVFEQQWETWKGNQKQTDDVLLIGVKFQ